jgi:hypothetical protein
MASTLVSADESVRANPPARLGETHRQDAWWIGSALTVLVLGLFGVYATFRAAYNAEYNFGHGALSARVDAPQHAYLLSPFYAPLLVFPWLPSWISPAFLILWAPGGFRLTCYYYRKAYYRAFFLDPPGCAVGEGRKRYAGETRLFLFQNLHRFFLYFALLFLVLLAIDVGLAAAWPTAEGGWRFGVSVGTLVLLLNVMMLSMYTFGCHSLRHLVGGNVDCFSCVKFGQSRQRMWKGVSWLNKRHMEFAWISLFAVGFADFYVWMVARGMITDWRLF